MAGDLGSRYFWRSNVPGSSSWLGPATGGGSGFCAYSYHARHTTNTSMLSFVQAEIPFARVGRQPGLGGGRIGNCSR